MTTISAMPVLDQATIDESSRDTFAVLTDYNSPLDCFYLSTPLPLNLDCTYDTKFDAWAALVSIRQDHPNGMAWAIEHDVKIKGAQVLYSALADIPVNEDGEIEEAFLHFDTGTTGIEIWHWFESYFDISIAELEGC